MRLPLHTKLVLLVAAPLLVLVAAAARGVQRAADDARAGQRAAGRVELSLAATTAALELAHERVLSTQPPGDTRTANALTFQRDRTSHAVEALRDSIAGGGRVDLGATPALDQLDRLGAARDAVDRRAPSAEEVLGTYAEIIDPVLDLDRAAGELPAVTPALAGRLESFQSLSRALHEVVVEQELLRSAFATGWLDAATYDRLVASLANQRLWLDQFERDADAGQLARYAKAVGLPDATIATRLREQALAAGRDGPVDGNADAWTVAMDRKLDGLEDIAHDTADDLAADARDQRAGAARRHDRSLLLLAGAVALAGAVLGLLQRTALRPLRRLAAATDAARATLPSAVHLARAEGADAARRALTPVPVPRDRDLAGLARAFNGAQSAALGLATDEAEVRSRVNTVFLHFGERTQDLVTRQLGHIDDLEARIEAPDTLSDLFLLDHLSTRLRRNAESLMVLAGADPPRPWSRPVSLMNVVRAAVAESVDYARVQLDGIAPGAVSGSAANEVSHLLAELVDNALAHSPAGARVRLAGDWVEGARYLVTVTGAGAGMSSRQIDEANARISGSNESDPEMARHFGLFVAGRLARRHGIDVRLAPAREEGTAAEVLLPDTLMVGTPTECPTTTGR